MAWDFRVGMEVVALVTIAGDRWARNCPVAGEVYTIRDIEPAVEGGSALRLVELVNPEFWFTDKFGETIFRERYFRPLQSYSIDSLLTLTVPHEDAPKEVERV